MTKEKNMATLMANWTELQKVGDKIVEVGDAAGRLADSCFGLVAAGQNLQKSAGLSSVVAATR